MPSSLDQHDFHLVPVVEICPWHVTDRPTPGPREPYGTATTADWAKYRDDAFADAGLESIPPIAPDADFYPVSSLTDSALLSKLAAKEFEEGWDLSDPMETENDALEHGTSFYGGVAILGTTGLISAPGCCCTLEVVQEWFALSKDIPTDWREIWSGHDVDRIQLRFVPDRNTVEIRLARWMTNEWDRELEITPTQLDAMLVRCNSHLIAFAQELEAALPIFIETSARGLTARRMAGLLHSHWN